MNTKSLLTAVLLVLAVGGIIYVLADGREQAPPPAAEAAGDGAATSALTAADSLPVDGVVVYYFHGRQRCYTCNKMEALADRVVAEQFAEQVRDGWVAFKTVNMQTPEHEHFVADFELRSAGVVMVERQQGQDLRWRRLDDVWTKIRNEDEYKTYIAENLTECLRDVGLETS
ncbi:MAG: nitrophenyl compound nitroreductase subunit ArsF family protein [Candidatus Krumholzibacteria bacterium]|jgi:hypothetical protein|nr:nitrophenyl compound nitroreductase subunit ArsF family protein [Candidatus Krumholzibacteria bacterium]